jgi:hypothetical protein
VGRVARVEDNKVFVRESVSEDFGVNFVHGRIILKWFLKKSVWCGVDSSGSELRPVTCHCEHANERLVFIKGGKCDFLCDKRLKYNYTIEQTYSQGSSTRCSLTVFNGPPR